MKTRFNIRAPLGFGLGIWQIRRVRHVVLALFSLAMLALGQDAPTAVPAARQADAVAVITVHGAIDSVTAYSVKKRLEQAAAGGASAIVIEINSPGGELGAVLELSGAIKSSPVPNTVAWVNPQAYSGGAIIAIACREIVVAPNAQMGDAFPVTPTLNRDQNRTGLRGLTPDERTKLLPPLLADVVDSARTHGYDEYLVQAIVIDGVELWLVEEQGTGRLFAINEAEYRRVFMADPPRDTPMIPRVTGTNFSPQAAAPAASAPIAGSSEDATFQPAAPSLADLRGAVTDRLTTDSSRPRFDETQQGRWIDRGYITDGSAPIVMSASQLASLGFATTTIANDEELKAYFGAKSLVRIDESWSESTSRFLTSMWVRGILIVIFLLALFIEMTSPGLVVPGAVALGAGFLLIAPPVIIGMAGWWEIGAIAAGILLIAMEIFVLPGFGFFGVVGFVALLAGLIGSFIPNSSGVLPGDAAAARDALQGLVTVLLAVLTASIGVYFISKHFGTIPLLSRLVLKDATDTDETPDSLVSLMGPDQSLHPRVGDTGTAITNLKPVGQAEINDRIVDVTSDLSFIRIGTPVRVVRVDAWHVVVEAAGEAPPEPSDDAPAEGETTA